MPAATTSARTPASVRGSAEFTIRCMAPKEAATPVMMHMKRMPKIRVRVCASRLSSAPNAACGMFHAVAEVVNASSASAAQISSATGPQPCGGLQTAMKATAKLAE